MNLIQQGLSIPSSVTQAKACSICLVTSTSQWHKDPNDKIKKRCHSCYSNLNLH